MSATVVDKAAYLAKHGFPWQPIRCHHLKAVGRCPAHGRQSLAGEETPETAAQSLGSTVHALIEGKIELVVYPGPVRRGKEWEAFKAKNEGARIVLQAERDQAMGMAEALLGNRDAARLVNARRVRREQTLYFDYLGRACRATPDLMARSWAWSAEIKTTKSADPAWFRRDAFRFWYHVQKAMQRMAMIANGGKPRKHFIIAVESVKPFPVSVFLVDKPDLVAGEKQMRLWMERLLGCEAAGQWPEYVQTVTPIQIVEQHLELEWDDDDDDDAGEEASP